MKRAHFRSFNSVMVKCFHSPRRIAWIHFCLRKEPWQRDDNQLSFLLELNLLFEHVSTRSKPYRSTRSLRHAGLTSLAFAQLDPGRPKGPPYLHSVQFSFSYGAPLHARFTFQYNQTAAMLVLRKLNLFLMKELSFVSINLHRRWPLEWKRSIECKTKGVWLIFIQ